MPTQCIRNKNKNTKKNPAALEAINSGGLFIAHDSLLPYVLAVTKKVVNQFREASKGNSPVSAIKETTTAVKK